MTSILNSIKEVRDTEPSDHSFDTAYIMHINSVFTDLTQLGIGPVEGYAIMGDTETWEDYLGAGSNYASVQSYMALRVQLLFDPPQTSFHIAAAERQIEKAEWRINAAREEEKWVQSQVVVVQP